MTPSIHSVATVEEIRRSFPALARLHNGLPVAYFDGPGGTQVPQQVVDAMVAYLLHHNANSHWHFPTSIETDQILDAARQAAADFVNASPEEIVFGANMTTLTFHLGRGLGREWGPGDEIVVTELDHRANVDTWRALAHERGMTVRVVAMASGPHGPASLDWEDLKQALTPRTRLLAIGAASNALGTVSDVAAAARLAHDVGALVFVDAVHYAPHMLVDVKALDCDFLACSAYKFYGPHLGMLYGKADLLQAIDIPKLIPAPDGIPHRLETGTQNHEAIAGTRAAIDFLAGLSSAGLSSSGLSPLAANNRRAALQHSFEALHARGQALVTRLWEGLEAIPYVTLYGLPPTFERTPTVSFTVRGVSAHQSAKALAQQALFVSSGDFYATTVVQKLGHSEDGVIRAGCACYTTESEIDRLIEGVRSLQPAGV